MDGIRPGAPRSAPYLVVGAIVAGTRKTRSQEGLRQRMMAALKAVNEKYQAALASRFVAVGNSGARGVLRAEGSAALPQLLEELADALSPLPLRCGVGAGTLDGEPQRLAVFVSGEAWQHAEWALEETARRRTPVAFVGLGLDDTLLTALASALLLLRARWTAEQRVAIRLVEEGLKNGEAAAQLGVSPVAVSKRLTAAAWPLYTVLRQTLTDRLELWSGQAPDAQPAGARALGAQLLKPKTSS